jgi:hypothetical protein
MLRDRACVAVWAEIIRKQISLKSRCSVVGWGPCQAHRNLPSHNTIPTCCNYNEHVPQFEPFERCQRATKLPYSRLVSRTQAEQKQKQKEKNKLP